MIWFKKNFFITLREEDQIAENEEPVIDVNVSVGVAQDEVAGPRGHAGYLPALSQIFGNRAVIHILEKNRLVVVVYHVTICQVKEITLHQEPSTYLKNRSNCFLGAVAVYYVTIVESKHGMLKKFGP